MSLRPILTIALVAGGFTLCFADQKKGDKDDGFVSLFNGKNLNGWKVMGHKAGWQVNKGVIRSEGASGGN